jgi:Ca-activated chloride channel homolog
MRSAIYRWMSRLLLATVALALIPVLTPLALAQSPDAPPRSPTNLPVSPNAGQQDATPPEQSAPNPGDAPQSPDSSQQPSADPANDQNSMFVFKKQVQEVVLHASVVDDQFHLVPSLDKSAFIVFENGEPQVVTSFRREDVPVAMGIVIDNSGSMRDKRDAVNRAVLNLIRASNPQDEIFVVNFGQNYYLDQDFTSDVNLLQAALHQISSAGSTALYDAIVASAVHLKNNPRLDKKVLLVITDGQDNMSQETLQEATRKLQQANGPTLYAIGLTGGGLQNTGREALQHLAQGTGGVAYFPETIDQVENITRTLAHDIRSQYSIAYKPKNQNVRPEYQSVKVEAHAPGYAKLTVRAKTGYFSPQNAH